MKKLGILLITLLLLTGCVGDKKEKIDEKEFILEKVNKEEDFVYLENFETIKYDNNKVYEINNIVINIKSEDALNVNLELKNFVLNSYDNMDVNDGYMNYGNIIDYDYFNAEHFVSVVQNYYFYMKGTDKEISSNVYVISKDTGKLMSNKDILDYYEISEERIYLYLEDNIDNEDIEFVIMQIKNEGYQLYVNNDNKIVIIYSEVLNDGIVKKELIFD